MTLWLREYVKTWHRGVFEWPIPLPSNMAGWWLSKRLCEAHIHHAACRGYGHCPRNRGWRCLT